MASTANLYDPSRAQEEGQAGQGATNGATQDNNDLAWWIRWIIKIGVILVAISVVICGVFTFLTPSILCIIAGIFLILAGVVIVGIEAPMCCKCIPWLDKVQGFLHNRPKWQKAGLYGLLGVIPIAMCQSPTVIIGFILLLACAILYGILAVGRKADRGTMLGRAGPGAGEAQPEHDKADLVPPPPAYTKY